MLSQQPDENGPQVLLVRAGSAPLVGALLLPPRALGVVLFAEVSGSTFPNPSALFLARALGRSNLASLVVNLLTSTEAAADARTGWLRTDTALLASRVTAVQHWLMARPETRDLPVGLFGAGLAAPAVLAAAADEPGFAAIVCCPDEGRLAEPGLEAVQTPTLLISGMEEPELRAADRALAALRCERELAVVPGATHLHEPGALEAVADLAARWFNRHLAQQWLAAHPAELSP